MYKKTAVPTIYENSETNAFEAKVIWSPSKSIWVMMMYLFGIYGVLFLSSIENFLVFLISSAITLCLGHSLGMHRRLIHQSYECPKWLEYLFVHFGVIVGLAGPFGMVRTHDTRDWAQRQPQCHPYFSHQSSFLKDGFWQIHCDIVLKHPPIFKEESILDTQFYRFMEKTWMLQQLPLALILYLIGGVEWVIWGICLRVAISVTGHWLIGYFAHNSGHRSWHVNGAGVQGYNIKFCGLITMGECWHNNHHAFPGSAKLGLEKGQSDPGWWVLIILSKIGLVKNLKLVADLEERQELVPYHQKADEQC
ncbi:acyl-CoA desaturase [Acinetobacter guillouiae]|uniref:acyl-CoA desaturase n=1 Tax=Acinetobacter guillouiae TaxID=106649 RepID=UPI001AE3ACE7|nr:acyl-CoA desaturase [Acinetobacter guillouiae]MBP2546878.1 stearoyl-CoA desaturase (delta-9 desaturase) [Acinetobacter guillouiae]